MQGWKSNGKLYEQQQGKLPSQSSCTCREFGPVTGEMGGRDEIPTAQQPTAHGSRAAGMGRNCRTRGAAGGYLLLEMESGYYAGDGRRPPKRG